jgi:chromosome segregation ATPase
LLQDFIERIKEMASANEAHTQLLNDKLQVALEENKHLRSAIHDADKRASDSRLDTQVANLRETFSTEMARTREQNNALGELIMSKDLEIKELVDYKESAQARMESLEKDEAEVKQQCMTLRIDNKELMSQVESLQMRLAGAAKMETLACDMRLTIEKERQLCEELVAEKERTLNLELEMKDLQHKMDAMHASSQEQRDLQQISDGIREMVSSSRDSAAELLEEKERSLSLHVDNATMRREIELLREYSKEQEGKLETVLGEINQLGTNFEGARSLASDLLVEKERAAQLLAENVSLRQQVIASGLTFLYTS